MYTNKDAHAVHLALLSGLGWVMAIPRPVWAGGGQAFHVNFRPLRNDAKLYQGGGWLPLPS